MSLCHIGILNTTPHDCILWHFCQEVLCGWLETNAWWHHRKVVRSTTEMLCLKNMESAFRMPVCLVQNYEAITKCWRHTGKRGHLTQCFVQPLLFRGNGHSTRFLIQATRGLTILVSRTIPYKHLGIWLSCRDLSRKFAFIRNASLIKLTLYGRNPDKTRIRQERFLIKIRTFLLIMRYVTQIIFLSWRHLDKFLYGNKAKLHWNAVYTQGGGHEHTTENFRGGSTTPSGVA